MSTRKKNLQPRQGDGGGGPQPAGDGVSPLLAKARAFGKVARKALEDCDRGAAAEQQLHQRRNRPGQ